MNRAPRINDIMLTCPMCKKGLQELDRQCPTCRTDLSLLVDYAHHLNEGLVQAEALTRAGQLDQAVWAYLQVLEVEPDNREARRQVGRVATAVRQFDRAALRHWRKRLKPESRPWAQVIVLAAMFLLALTALGGGYWWGYINGRSQQQPPAPAAQTQDQP